MSFNNTDPFSRSYTNNVFPGKVDLTDPDVLLQLAQDHGGAVASAADEIMHPTNGILSTISDGFKKTFNGFVDILQTPSEVVAGILSDKYSVSDAMKKHLKVSDILFGTPKKSDSIDGTIVNWTGRFAIDVLTDPITYLSFGASAIGKFGLLGIGAVKKIGLEGDIGRDIASSFGEKALNNFEMTGVHEAHLNKQGYEVYQSLQTQATKNLIRNGSGLAQEESIVNAITGKAEKILSREDFNMSNDILEQMMKTTLDSPLNMDYAAAAVSKLIQKSPQLAETLLDKGGIKWAGIQILEGQRISSLIQAIPAFSVIDHLTTPVRNSLKGMFSTAHEKMADGSYIRMPGEITELETTMKDLARELGDKRILRSKQIAEENGLTPEDGLEITKQVDSNKAFLDPTKEKARQLLMGIDGKEELDYLRTSGQAISDTKQGMAHVVSTEYMKSKQAGNLNSNMGRLTTTIGAAKQQTIRKFVRIDDPSKVFIGRSDVHGLTQHLTKEDEDLALNRFTSSAIAGEKHIGQLKDEIGELSQAVREVYENNLSGKFSKILENADVETKETFKQMMNVLNNEVGALDIDKLATRHAQETMQAGVKIPKEDIVKELNDMSPDAIKLLQDRITGGMLKLPEDMEKFNSAIKESLASKSEEVVKKVGTDPNGELAKFAEKLKLGNSALTFKHVNENTDTQAMAKMIESMKSIFEQDRGGAKRLLDQILGKKQAITDVIHDMNLDRTTMKQELSRLPTSEQFFSDVEGHNYTVMGATIKEANDEAIRNGFGKMFEDDALKIIAIRGVQNVNSVVGYQYAHSLAEKFSTIKEFAGTGWRPVNLSMMEKTGRAIDAQLGQMFEERYFAPAIAQRIENSFNKFAENPGSKEFLNTIDRIQNFWKASVTSIFPAFSGMNFISNVMQSMLDIGIHALSPFVNGVATKMIYDDRRLFKLEQMAMNVGKEGTIAKEEIAKIMSKNMFTDTTGTIWTYGEMRQLIQRKNIAFNNNSNVGMLDVRSEQTVEKIYAHNDSVLKKAYNNFNPIDGDNLIMSSAKHLSGAVEEQARIVNFIVNLKKTGDPMLAAQRTKMFLFDYGNLTRFERTIMKRIIPFYTFTRKNLELQAHMVMSQPGRIEAEITGVQTLGDAISGNQLTESEKKALPDWLRNGIILLKDKRGSTLSIISNLKTPIEQPFQAFQPNNLLGSISPLIKIPFEQMSGYSLYNGKMLSDVTNATAFKNAPKPLKDFIGFTERKGTYKDGTPYLWYESVRPERMNLFLNLGVTARTLGTLKQLERADASTGEKILNFMTGIRTNTIDLEKEQAKRDKDYVDRLTKLEQSVGIVGVTNKTFIPKNN